MTFNQLKKKAEKLGGSIEELNGEAYCVVVDAPEGMSWNYDPFCSSMGSLICEMQEDETKSDVHKDIADRMDTGLKPYVVD